MSVASRLGARRLTPYLLITYSALLLLIFAWGARIPGMVVGRIADLWPFPIIYAAAAIHLACCLVLFWPALRRVVSLDKPDGPGVRLTALEAKAVESGARRAGMRVRWLGPASAVLYRYRFSPAGTLVSHGALLLLPLAFVTSQATRFRGDAWIVEGHAFGGTRDEYTHVEPEDSFDDRAPRVGFLVEDVEAEFWGDRLFFTDLRALVRPDGGGEAAWLTLHDPLRMGGARLTIHGFNYTLAYELAGPGGASVATGDLNLRLFPPGVEDSFMLPGLPHRFFVRLSSPRGGFVLDQPIIRLTVTRGKRLVTSAAIRPGDSIEINGQRLAFPLVRRAGEIMVQRDLGYPILWLALILLLGGSVARIGFPSARIWLDLHEDGARAIVREDAFCAGRASALVEGWR